MTSINTNLSSLIVQKNLTKSTNALNQAVERLTTGFKINHASDNAANYSISESMSSKLSSYMVAEDNTSMGLDLISTQSSTLDTIQNLTTRLRALAEQAHNGTYGAQSLEAINQEAEAIISEIERIGNNAEYNGIKLFDNALSQAGIPQLKSNGLMQEVERRDTSGMTRLADVNPGGILAQGTYSISSAEELEKLATMQNSGKISAGSEFVLGADIDLSEYSDGEGWSIIGKYSDKKFSSTFDGNGYTISNLYINRETAPSEPGAVLGAPRLGGGGGGGTPGYQTRAVGLFGYTNGATIENLKLTNCEVTDDITTNAEYVGILVGLANDNTNISNCSVAGYVSNGGTTGTETGIIVGMLEEECAIEYCYSNGHVESIGRGGGIVGNAINSEIEKCYTNADINAVCAGGLAGIIADTNINNSASCNNVNGSDAAGGLVGEIQSGTIENSLVLGSIAGVGDNGMVAGWLDHEANIQAQYDSYLSSDIEMIGDIYDAAVLTLDVKDTASRLQVGVDSTDASSIKFTTNMSLSSISSLRGGMEGANSLENIDAFISKLSEAQTKLGAVENRLTSAIESIGVNIENLTSSRSTLKDADVAKESSQLLKNQILQQAAATLLATANQTPAIALRLLGRS